MRYNLPVIEKVNLKTISPLVLQTIGSESQQFEFGLFSGTACKPLSIIPMKPWPLKGVSCPNTVILLTCRSRVDDRSLVLMQCVSKIVAYGASKY